MQYLVSPDLLYGLSGFCVGVLVGMTGVGGGSLMTPLLILLFGVHPTTAVGTDLLFAASTKATGTIVHAAARTVDWMLVTLLAIGSVPATIATLRRIRARYADRLNRLDPRTAGLFTIGLGLTMGVLVTTTSVGAGAIGVTVLLLLHPKLPASRVVGSDIAHGVPLTLLAGAGHWYLGSIDWSLLANLLIGSLPGIVFGSYLATRARDAVVRIALASILVVVGVRLLG